MLTSGKQKDRQLLKGFMPHKKEDLSSSEYQNYMLDCLKQAFNNSTIVSCDEARPTIGDMFQMKKASDIWAVNLFLGE